MFRGNISWRSSEILIHMSLPHHLIRKDIISSGVIGRGGGACLDQRLHNIKEKWKQRTNKQGLSPNFSLIPITPSTKQRLLKHGEGDRTRHLVMFLLVSYRHKKKQIFMICYRDFTSETPGKCLLSSRVKKKKRKKILQVISLHTSYYNSLSTEIHACWWQRWYTYMSSELFIATLSFNVSHLPGFFAGFVCFTMLPFKSLSTNQTDI